MASVFTSNIAVKAYFLTKNGSYTANVKKTKTKLMLHSTATPWRHCSEHWRIME